MSNRIYTIKSVPRTPYEVYFSVRRLDWRFYLAWLWFASYVPLIGEPGVFLVKATGSISNNTAGWLALLATAPAAACWSGIRLSSSRLLLRADADGLTVRRGFFRKSFGPIPWSYITGIERIFVEPKVWQYRPYGVRSVSIKLSEHEELQKELGHVPLELSGHLSTNAGLVINLLWASRRFDEIFRTLVRYQAVQG